MGFFSNLNIEQETDLEYPAVHQAEEAALKAEPAYTSPSVEPADGVKAVSVAAGAPKADETGNTQPAQQTEEEKRKAHEAAEEKRKAEWEERQRLRREKEQIEWEKAVALDNNALIAASVKRLGDATERLTRRNMKLCVTEYVQTLCYEDMEFARLAMHPRKSMVNCFHRINRKAREYLEKEMKDNDEQPENGAFGGDVPDGICYQWAEEYFRDLDAEEDKTDADNISAYVNRSTSTAIRNYLGTGDGRLIDLLNYQLKIREEQLEQRHKKETDKWDNDLAQTPPLPRDWKRWVDKVAIPENFIFYHYKKGGAKTGYCSYCEKEVPIQHPLYNKEGRCPCCRHKITFKSIGRVGFFQTQKASFYLIQCCKDGLMLREFEGCRTYRKGEYMTPECYIHEIRRMICDKNAIPQRAYYWGLYKQKSLRWISGYINRGGWWSDYSGRVYGRTLPYLSRHELKKTGLIEYIRQNKIVDPEEYLIAYEKHPYIEKFVKAGLSRLAQEYVKGKHRYDNDNVPLSIQESSLTKLLGIDGQELKRLRQNNGGSGFLNWMQYEKASGQEIPDYTISWLCGEEITPRDLKFVRGKMSVPQIHNYITRQMSKEHMSSHNVINTWADYLSMAKGLRMNTDNELVYRVRDLRKRHNELVQICQKQGKNIIIQVGRILEEYPHIDEICQSLKGKYEYGNEQYMIIAPSGVEEIILEGRALTHCVSNSDRYWERIENRESYILFLRKSSEPEKPYYTLEIEPDGTIRQKRSILNEQYEDINQAKDFLLEWQKAVAKRLTDEDRSLAGQSRILRMEEFEQLRKDQVTVRTGTLSGKLLVDVLMGDLMETAA